MQLFDQITFVSDHDLLFCSFDIDLNKVDSPSIFSFHDYSRINHSELFVEASLIDWSYCWNSVSVDDKLACLVSVVRRLFDKHVPVRISKQNSNSCPWMNDGVLVAIRLRNKLHTNWKSRLTWQNWENLKNA